MSDQQVILVDFFHRRPFTVLSTSKYGCYTNYDIEHSRLDQELYYEGVGSGGFPLKYEMPPNNHFYYWLNPEFEDRVTVIGGRRIKHSKYAVMPWNYACDSGVVWCDKCQDVRPCESVWGGPCEHIQWCDECADWKTENEDNYCQHEINE